MRLGPISDLFRGAAQDLRQRPHGNIPALDVLRCVAILIVFTSHYGTEFNTPPWAEALPMFSRGWAGVDLFFVLSGFLIGTQIWKEAKRTGTIQVGRFLLRRGLRIWPLYYAFVALVAFEGLFGRNLSGLWADVFFVSNYFHNQISGGWSLSSEEQFYIIAPLSVALLSRLIKPRYLWVLPAGGLLDLVVNRFIVIKYAFPVVTNQLWHIFVPLYVHADGLAIGGLLAWLAVFRPNLIRSTRARLSTCAGMVVLGVGLYFLNRTLFNFTSLALIFGAATLFGLGLQPTTKLLDWRGFYVISRLSYGMYLNHVGLLPHLHSWFLLWREQGGEPAFWILYLICLSASIGVAFVTFQLIEWPFLQIRARWLASTNQQQSQPGPQAAAPAS